MLAVKSVNVRDNFKEWCDKISMGETVVILCFKGETGIKPLTLGLLFSFVRHSVDHA